MNKQENIEKKITASILKVAFITAAAAVVGLIALLVISNRYSSALKNYGFSQGDIGRAMFDFADIRSSLRAAIGYDDQEAIDKVVQQHEERIEEFKEDLKVIEKTLATKDEQAKYDDIVARLDEYWALDTEIMDLGATTDREKCRQAQDMALTDLSDAYHGIYDELDELLNINVEKGDSLSTILTIVSWILAAVIIAVIIASILLSAKIGKTIGRNIANPLGQLGARLKTFSAGDLTSPFPQVDTGDEVEHMEKDATEMAENLEHIIYDIEDLLGKMAEGDYTVKSNVSEKYTGDFKKLYDSMVGLKEQMTQTLLSIGEASNQVSAGSGELANASQSLAEGATEQASAVQQLHASISDITVAMERSSESADESYEKAQLSAEQADHSRQEMNTMMTAMERITETSTRIGDIISEIESIASQTNLLSLNASIEAARAGESGRGFAVVADQIRELADQSAQAAVDTRELIEASLKEVSEGNNAADRASHAIESVVDGIKQIADFSRNLKVMMQDQAEAMRQAEIGINQISGVVQSNAATAQEASATSEELSAQATMLDELVGQFELPA